MSIRPVAAVLFVVALRAPALPAQSPDAVLSALERVRLYKEATISPDGRWVAWADRVADPEGREALSTLWIAESAAASARPRRVTAARDGKPHRERGLAFSPDGKTLAFLSDAASPGQLQLWTVPATGGAPRVVTRVSGQLDDPRWSPDGRRIAFLFVEGSAQETGALVAYAPDAGVVGEKVFEQQIAVADPTTGRVRSVSPPNLFVYDYDWSPDGRRFAAEAAEGSGTNNYWIARLYLVAADTGETRSLWKPPLQLATPRFAADGKSVVVIHGLMSDEGSNGGDVWQIPVEGGGEPRNLTPGMPASAAALTCLASGAIVFLEHVDGEMGVARLDPASGKIETLARGPERLDHFALSRDGRVSAVVRDSFERPPEVAAGAIGSWRAVSRDNAGARRLWGKAESLHWESGGHRVQGWLLYPAGFDPSRKYPLAVTVHGGPSSAAEATWPLRWNALLASQGYFVFLPNPRGSYGFGEAFTQANVKDFGHGDLADILAGVDAALAAAPIDPARLGILGWSYGGYMTMWAVTQTNRFAAAVAGAGIVDWRSYYGQNRIDRWMIPFFGASVYESPEVYARSSPIEHIRNVKTPTLVLHGDRDSEVPTPQGYEFWHALKTLGVETELVIYPNEGHSIRRRAHQRDRDLRILDWFDRHLSGKAARPASAGTR